MIKKIIENNWVANKIAWIASPPLSPQINRPVEDVIKVAKQGLEAITQNHLFKGETQMLNNYPRAPST